MTHRGPTVPALPGRKALSQHAAVEIVSWHPDLLEGKSPVILGIGPSDSAAAELLASTGTGLMIDWSTDPSELIREAADTCVGVDTAGKAAAYSRRTLAAKLAELLNSL